MGAPVLAITPGFGMIGEASQFCPLTGTTHAELRSDLPQRSNPLLTYKMASESRGAVSSSPCPYLMNLRHNTPYRRRLPLRRCLQLELDERASTTPSLLSLLSPDNE
jgi:hypothetical protein